MRILSFILLLSGILFFSCAKEGGGTGTELSRRVLMVYLGGDSNGLSSETDQKIEQMRRGWTGSGGEIIIYQDATDKAPRLLRLAGTGRAGEAVVEELETYPEESHASAQVLGRVLKGIPGRYPAESYGLLVFSHATGWLPQGAYESPSMSTRTIFRDGREEGGQEMDISDFARALPSGIFDFIIFEACYMAGIEVAYELREKCGYVLASAAEIISPGFTGLYEGNIMKLFGSASLESALISFGNSYGDLISAGGLWGAGTLSLIRTSAIEGLAAACSRVISGNYNDPGLDLSGLQRFDRPATRSACFFDLREYLENRGGRTMDAVFDEVVVWEYHSDNFLNDNSNKGFPITTHCGLTTYIPQPEYPLLNNKYYETAWYRAVCH